MKSIKRYLANQAEADLERKMVFVTGPRQAGKTTLALSLPGARTGYLNWDVAEHRSRILQRELPDSSLWVFDEIHKHRQWRDWLKGLYDVRASGQRILVTGSGRLDLYRFGGDSLQGRYRLLRLHPLSFAELGLASTADLNELLTLGGFPEPWTSASATSTAIRSSGRRPRCLCRLPRSRFNWSWSNVPPARASFSASASPIAAPRPRRTGRNWMPPVPTSRYSASR